MLKKTYFNNNVHLKCSDNLFFVILIHNIYFDAKQYFRLYTILKINTIFFLKNEFQLIFFVTFILK